MSKQILVVDDSAAIRTSTTFVLEQEGYSVVQAEDGQDGLGKMESNGPFDLVITDINMPNMDGIEFTKKVRENADWKFIPIVVLTTESQESKMKEEIGRAHV